MKYKIFKVKKESDGRYIIESPFVQHNTCNEVKVHIAPIIEANGLKYDPVIIKKVIHDLNIEASFAYNTNRKIVLILSEGNLSYRFEKKWILKDGSYSLDELIKEAEEFSNVIREITSKYIVEYKRNKDKERIEKWNKLYDF